MTAESPGTLVLGLSAFYHDSAAALVADGVPVAAFQEERFSRRRHDPSFPRRAVSACLDYLGVSLDDVAAVAYYEDPRIKFRRILASYAAAGPSATASFGRTMVDWIPRKLRVARQIERELAALERGTVPPIGYQEHHHSHAASAFLPSPYESAAVLCVDGVGEWATTTIWHGRGTTARAGRRDPVPPLARPPVLGVHLLLRLQGRLRRVQADGPRPLRPAGLRRPHPARADRRRTGRLVPPTRRDTSSSSPAGR